MRAARVLFVVTLLVAGLSAAAMAQDRITAPGTYNVKVAIVPAALPDGGASLPADLQNVGPDLYVGTLTVSQSGGGYSVTFRGEREDGARLAISASFSSDWTGFVLGNLVVGSSLESGVVTSIDVAHLLDARINGIGTVSGANHRVMVRVGANGTIESYRIGRAPGPFRQ